jgi:hypothetical protein
MGNHRPLALLLPDLERFAVETGRDRSALSSLKHRKIVEFALDRKIPAERINGRWHFSPAELPRIADALGLAAPQQTKSPRRNRISAPQQVAA